MWIKQFRLKTARVADPDKPGKRIFVEKMFPSDAHSISHQGAEYRADEDGWFDVPQEVGSHLLGFRAPGGERFFEPQDVDEEIRLGGVADADKEAEKLDRLNKQAGRVAKKEK